MDSDLPMSQRRIKCMYIYIYSSIYQMRITSKFPADLLNHIPLHQTKGITMKFYHTYLSGFAMNSCSVSFLSCRSRTANCAQAVIHPVSTSRETSSEWDILRRVVIYMIRIVATQHQVELVIICSIVIWS